MKYTYDAILAVIKDCFTYSDILRKFNTKITGGSLGNIKKVCMKFNIDTSHFVGNSFNKGKSSFNRKSAGEILIKNSLDRRENVYRLRRSLIEIGRTHVCELCGNDGNHNGMKLTLHIDHIDGDFTNNEPDNLRFLCPNCHSQTETFGSKRLKKNTVDKKPIIKKLNVRCSNCGKSKTDTRAAHCRDCYNLLTNRKVKDRPSKEVILKMLETMSYLKVGKYFGVSDNTIRKWLK